MENRRFGDYTADGWMDAKNWIEHRNFSKGDSKTVKASDYLIKPGNLW